jgi:hypothetical protein
MKRQFTASPGKRGRVPLLIGIAGPSGSGKTYSALRLASGIQRVTPGEIHVIDTEADRALHHAHDDKCGFFASGKCTTPGHFTFHHVPFAPPFGCLDYLEAIRYCVARGASTTIIDSASHMHEGEGGMLDQHEQAIDRATNNSSDWSKRDAASWRCWKEPKADMNRFVQCLLQMKVNVIFCFRAKDKLQPGMKDGKKTLESRGTMAIGDDLLIYEMIVQPLLEAGSRGVPDWSPSEKGAALQTKLPGFFSELLKRKGQQLDEDMGEMMGRWAAGASLEAAPAATGQRKPVPAVAPQTGASAPQTGSAPGSVLERVKAAASLADVDAISGEIRALSNGWTEEEKKAVREAFRVRRQELA